MAAIHVHEFMSLDGLIDAPEWTFDYGFLPQTERPSARSRIVAEASCSGARTYEMFEPAWSKRTVVTRLTRQTDAESVLPLVAGSDHTRLVRRSGWQVQARRSCSGQAKGGRSTWARSR